MLNRLDVKQPSRYHTLLFILGAALTVWLASCSQQTHRAQGYIEGRYTYVAAPVAGRLLELSVKRGDVVHTHQTLFHLEARPEQDVYNNSVQLLNQANAQRAAQVANVRYTEITLQRDQTLVMRHALDVATRDSALAQRDAAVAQLAANDANIAALTATVAANQWHIQQKIQTAPVNGEVFDTYYRSGEYVSAGSPILSLLAPTDIRVIFYITETALSQIKIGEKVNVYVDGQSHAQSAIINFIAPTAEYTPPIIYSNETRTKLVYRVEAAVPVAQAHHWHPGQPVDVDWQ